MAEKSSFFTSLNGDRKYKASDFAEYFGTFISNGVFPNPNTNLQVTSSGDMTVTVSPGYAWINGYMYNNTDILELKIDTGDGVLDRIDRIVIRLDFTNRNITANVKKGTLSSNPIPTYLQRDNDVYEICIAEINVKATKTTILQSDIKDTRMDDEVCGMVNSLIKVDSAILTDKLEKDFYDWLETIKDILDEDVAANLLNRIIALEEVIGDIDKIEFTASNITTTDGKNVQTVLDNINNILNVQSSRATYIINDIDSKL